MLENKRVTSTVTCIAYGKRDVFSAGVAISCACAGGAW